jgi:hypothetical protein
MFRLSRSERILQSRRLRSACRIGARCRPGGVARRNLTGASNYATGRAGPPPAGRGGRLTSKAAFADRSRRLRACATRRSTAQEIALVATGHYLVRAVWAMLKRGTHGALRRRRCAWEQPHTHSGRFAAADDADCMSGKSRARLAPILTEPSSWKSDRRVQKRSRSRVREVIAEIVPGWRFRES